MCCISSCSTKKSRHSVDNSSFSALLRITVNFSSLEIRLFISKRVIKDSSHIKSYFVYLNKIEAYSESFSIFPCRLNTDTYLRMEWYTRALCLCSFICSKRKLIFFECSLSVSLKASKLSMYVGQ
eukprot:NODE_735_length_4708_cov_0.180122.p5 type:complete len:125 gc:universal NODE_735_length_4708_cov_0.180122:3826-4200(+)